MPFIKKPRPEAMKIMEGSGNVPDLLRRVAGVSENCEFVVVVVCDGLTYHTYQHGCNSDSMLDCTEVLLEYYRCMWRDEK